MICLLRACLFFYRSNRGVRVYVVLFAVPAITLLRNREIFPTPKIIVRGRKALLTVAGVKKWWEVSEASWDPATWSRRLLRGAGELLPTREPSQGRKVLERWKLYLRDRGDGSGCSNPGSH